LAGFSAPSFRLFIGAARKMAVVLATNAIRALSG